MRDAPRALIFLPGVIPRGNSRASAAHEDAHFAYAVGNVSPGAEEGT